MAMQPHIRPFNQLKQYDQDEPGKAIFRWVLEKDEIPDV